MTRHFPFSESRIKSNYVQINIFFVYHYNIKPDLYKIPFKISAQNN